MSRPQKFKLEEGQKYTFLKAGEESAKPASLNNTFLRKNNRIDLGPYLTRTHQDVKNFIRDYKQNLNNSPQIPELLKQGLHQKIMNFEPRSLERERRPFSLNTRDEGHVQRVTHQALLSGTKSEDIVVPELGKNIVHSYLAGARDHSTPLVDLKGSTLTPQRRSPKRIFRPRDEDTQNLFNRLQFQNQALQASASQLGKELEEQRLQNDRTRSHYQQCLLQKQGELDALRIENISLQGSVQALDNQLRDARSIIGQLSRASEPRFSVPALKNLLVQVAEHALHNSRSFNQQVLAALNEYDQRLQEADLNLQLVKAKQPDEGSARRLDPQEIIEELKSEKENLVRKLKVSEDNHKELRMRNQNLNKAYETLQSKLQEANKALIETFKPYVEGTSTEEVCNEVVRQLQQQAQRLHEHERHSGELSKQVKDLTVKLDQAASDQNRELQSINSTTQKLRIENGKLKQALKELSDKYASMESEYQAGLQQKDSQQIQMQKLAERVKQADRERLSHEQQNQQQKNLLDELELHKRGLLEKQHSSEQAHKAELQRLTAQHQVEQQHMQAQIAQLVKQVNTVQARNEKLARSVEELEASRGEVDYSEYENAMASQRHKIATLSHQLEQHQGDIDQMKRQHLSERHALSAKHLEISLKAELMANHLVKVSHKLQQLQQELSTCNAERDTLHATLTENSRHEALERDRILAAMKHELENVVGEREHLQEFSNKVLQANEALERELRGLKEDMAGESELSMLKQQLQHENLLLRQIQLENQQQTNQLQALHAKEQDLLEQVQTAHGNEKGLLHQIERLQANESEFKTTNDDLQANKLVLQEEIRGLQANDLELRNQLTAQMREAAILLEEAAGQQAREHSRMQKMLEKESILEEQVRALHANVQDLQEQLQKSSDQVRQAQGVEQGLLEQIRELRLATLASRDDEVNQLLRVIAEARQLIKHQLDQIQEGELELENCTRELDAAKRRTDEFEQLKSKMEVKIAELQRDIAAREADHEEAMMVIDSLRQEREALTLKAGELKDIASSSQEELQQLRDEVQSLRDQNYAQHDQIMNMQWKIQELIDHEADAVQDREVLVGRLKATEDAGQALQNELANSKLEAAKLSTLLQASQANVQDLEQVLDAKQESIVRLESENRAQQARDAEQQNHIHALKEQLVHASSNQEMELTIQHLQDIEQQLQDQLRSMEQSQGESNKAYQKQVAQLQSALDDSALKIWAMNTDLENVRQQKDLELHQQHERAQAEMNQLRKQNQEFEKRQLVQTIVRVSHLEDDAQRADRANEMRLRMMNDAQEDAERLREDLDELRDQKDKLQGDYDKLRKNVKHLEASLAEAQTNGAAANESLAALQLTLEAEQLKKTEAQAEIQNLQGKVDQHTVELNTLINANQQLEAQVKDLTAQKDQLNKDVEGVRSELSKVQHNLGTIQAKLEEALVQLQSRQQHDNGQLQVKYEEAQAHFGQLQAKQEISNKELESLQVKNQQLEDNLAKVQAEETDKQQQQQQQLDQLQEKLSAAEADHQVKLNDLNAQLKLVRDEASQLRANLQNCEDQLEASKKENLLLTTQIKEHEVQPNEQLDSLHQRLNAQETANNDRLAQLKQENDLQSQRLESQIQKLSDEVAHLSSQLQASQDEYHKLLEGSNAEEAIKGELNVLQDEARVLQDRYTAEQTARQQQQLQFDKQQQQVADLLVEVENLKEDLKHSLTDHQLQQEEVQRLRSELQSISEISQKLQGDLNAANQQHEAAVSQLKLSSDEKEQALLAKFTELEQNQVHLQDELSERQGHITTLQQSTQAQIQELTDQKAQQDDTIKHLENQLNQGKQQTADLEARLSVAILQASDLTREYQSAQTNQQAKIDSMQDEYQLQLQQATSTIDELRTQQGQLNEEKERQLTDLGSLQEQLLGQEATESDLRQQLADLQEERTQLITTLSALEAAKRDELAVMAEQMHQLKFSLQGQISVLQERYSELSDSFDAKEKELTAMRLKYQQLQSVYSTNDNPKDDMVITEEQVMKDANEQKHLVSTYPLTLPQQIKEKNDQITMLDEDLRFKTERLIQCQQMLQEKLAEIQTLKEDLRAAHDKLEKRSVRSQHAAGFDDFADMSESHSQHDKNDLAELHDIIEQRQQDPEVMKFEMAKLRNEKQDLEEELKQGQEREKMLLSELASYQQDHEYDQALNKKNLEELQLFKEQISDLKEQNIQLDSQLQELQQIITQLNEQIELKSEQLDHLASQKEKNSEIMMHQLEDLERQKQFLQSERLSLSQSQKSLHELDKYQSQYEQLKDLIKQFLSCIIESKRDHAKVLLGVISNVVGAQDIKVDQVIESIFPKKKSKKDKDKGWSIFK